MYRMKQLRKEAWKGGILNRSHSKCNSLQREREPDVFEEQKKVDEAKSLGCAGSAQRLELEFRSQSESHSVLSDSL